MKILEVMYAQKSHKSNYLSSSISPTVRSNDSVSDIFDEKDNFKMEIVLGNKGTGFISDANGLHAGSVPKIGKRRMIFGLGMVWVQIMREHHNHQYWSYDPLLVKKPKVIILILIIFFDCLPIDTMLAMQNLIKQKVMDVREKQPNTDGI